MSPKISVKNYFKPPKNTTGLYHADLFNRNKANIENNKCPRIPKECEINSCKEGEPKCKTCEQQEHEHSLWSSIVNNAWAKKIAKLSWNKYVAFIGLTTTAQESDSEECVCEESESETESEQILEPEFEPEPEPEYICECAEDYQEQEILLHRCSCNLTIPYCFCNDPTTSAPINEGDGDSKNKEKPKRSKHRRKKKSSVTSILISSDDSSSSIHRHKRSKKSKLHHKKKPHKKSRTELTKSRRSKSPKRNHKSKEIPTTKRSKRRVRKRKSNQSITSRSSKGSIRKRRSRGSAGSRSSSRQITKRRSTGSIKSESPKREMAKLRKSGSRPGTRRSTGSATSISSKQKVGKRNSSESKPKVGKRRSTGSKTSISSKRKVSKRRSDGSITSRSSKRKLGKRKSSTHLGRRSSKRKVGKRNSSGSTTSKSSKRSVRRRKSNGSRTSKSSRSSVSKRKSSGSTTSKSSKSSVGKRKSSESTTSRPSRTKVRRHRSPIIISSGSSKIKVSTSSQSSDWTLVRAERSKKSKKKKVVPSSSTSCSATSSKSSKSVKRTPGDCREWLGTAVTGTYNNKEMMLIIHTLESATTQTEKGPSSCRKHSRIPIRCDYKDSPGCQAGYPRKAICHVKQTCGQSNEPTYCPNQISNIPLPCQKQTTCPQEPPSCNPNPVPVTCQGQPLYCQPPIQTNCQGLPLSCQTPVPCGNLVSQIPVAEQEQSNKETNNNQGTPPEQARLPKQICHIKPQGPPCFKQMCCQKFNPSKLQKPIIYKNISNKPLQKSCCQKELAPSNQMQFTHKSVPRGLANTVYTPRTQQQQPSKIPLSSGSPNPQGKFCCQRTRKSPTTRDQIYNGAVPENGICPHTVPQTQICTMPQQQICGQTMPRNQICGQTVPQQQICGMPGQAVTQQQMCGQIMQRNPICGHMIPQNQVCGQTPPQNRVICGQMATQNRICGHSVPQNQFCSQSIPQRPVCGQTMHKQICVHTVPPSQTCGQRVPQNQTCGHVMPQNQTCGQTQNQVGCGKVTQTSLQGHPDCYKDPYRVRSTSSSSVPTCCQEKFATFRKTPKQKKIRPSRNLKRKPNITNLRKRSNSNLSIRNSCASLQSTEGNNKHSSEGIGSVGGRTRHKKRNLHPRRRRSLGRSANNSNASLKSGGSNKHSSECFSQGTGSVGGRKRHKKRNLHPRRRRSSGNSCTSLQSTRSSNKHASECFSDGTGSVAGRKRHKKSNLHPRRRRSSGRSSGRSASNSWASLPSTGGSNKRSSECFSGGTGSVTGRKKHKKKNSHPRRRRSSGRSSGQSSGRISASSLSCTGSASETRGRSNSNWCWGEPNRQRANMKFQKSPTRKLLKRRSRSQSCFPKSSRKSPRKTFKYRYQSGSDRSKTSIGSNKSLRSNKGRSRKGSAGRESDCFSSTSERRPKSKSEDEFSVLSCFESDRSNTSLGVAGRSKKKQKMSTQPGCFLRRSKKKLRSNTSIKRGRSLKKKRKAPTQLACFVRTPTKNRRSNTNIKLEKCCKTNRAPLCFLRMPTKPQRGTNKNKTATGSAGSKTSIRSNKSLKRKPIKKSSSILVPSDKKNHDGGSIFSRLTMERRPRSKLTKRRSSTLSSLFSRKSKDRSRSKLVGKNSSCLSIFSTGSQGKSKKGVRKKRSSGLLGAAKPRSKPVKKSSSCLSLFSTGSQGKSKNKQSSRKPNKKKSDKGIDLSRICTKPKRTSRNKPVSRNSSCLSIFSMGSQGKPKKIGREKRSSRSSVLSLLSTGSQGKSNKIHREKKSSRSSFLSLLSAGSQGKSKKIGRDKKSSRSSCLSLLSTGSQGKSNKVNREKGSSRSSCLSLVSKGSQGKSKKSKHSETCRKGKIKTKNKTVAKSSSCLSLLSMGSQGKPKKHKHEKISSRRSSAGESDHSEKCTIPQLKTRNKPVAKSSSCLSLLSTGSQGKFKKHNHEKRSPSFYKKKTPGGSDHSATCSKPERTTKNKSIRKDSSSCLSLFSTGSEGKSKKSDRKERSPKVPRTSNKNSGGESERSDSCSKPEGKTRNIKPVEKKSSCCSLFSTESQGRSDGSNRSRSKRRTPSFFSRFRSRGTSKNRYKSGSESSTTTIGSNGSSNKKLFKRRSSRLPWHFSRSSLKPRRKPKPSDKDRESHCSGSSTDSRKKTLIACCSISSVGSPIKPDKKECVKVSCPKITKKPEKCHTKKLIGKKSSTSSVDRRRQSLRRFYKPDKDQDMKTQVSFAYKKRTSKLFTCPVRESRSKSPSRSPRASAHRRNQSSSPCPSHNSSRGNVQKRLSLYDRLFRKRQSSVPNVKVLQNKTTTTTPIKPILKNSSQDLSKRKHGRTKSKHSKSSSSVRKGRSKHRKVTSSNKVTPGSSQESLRAIINYNIMCNINPQKLENDEESISPRLSRWSNSKKLIEGIKKLKLRLENCVNPGKGSQESNLTAMSVLTCSVTSVASKKKLRWSKMSN